MPAGCGWARDRDVAVGGDCAGDVCLGGGDAGEGEGGGGEGVAEGLAGEDGWVGGGYVSGFDWRWGLGWEGFLNGM